MRINEPKWLYKEDKTPTEVIRIKHKKEKFKTYKDYLKKTPSKLIKGE